MILQRLATAIRHQNWSQIITEILIVIIGIFLGLQVTDWNERYKEQVTAKAQIVQLIRDTRIAIDNVTTRMEFEQTRIDTYTLVLKTLDGNELSPDKRNQFEEGLNNIYKIAPPKIAIGLVGSVLNGDDLEIRSRPDINRSLVAFQDEIKYNTDVIDLLSIGLNMSISVLNQYIAHRTEPTVPDINIKYDMDQIRNSSEFKIGFQNAVVMHSNRMEFAALNKQALESLLVALETEI